MGCLLLLAAFGTCKLAPFDLGDNSVSNENRPLPVADKRVYALQNFSRKAHKGWCHV